MSKNLGPKISYKCSSDCEQSGCPGHTVREEFCRSSDIYCFIHETGDKEIRRDYYDENEFHALLDSHKAALPPAAISCSDATAVEAARKGKDERIL